MCNKCSNPFEGLSDAFVAPKTVSLDTLGITWDKHQKQTDTPALFDTDSGDDIKLDKSTKVKDIHAIGKREKRKYLQEPLSLSLQTIVDHALNLLIDVEQCDGDVSDISSEEFRLMGIGRGDLIKYKKTFVNMFYCGRKIKKEGDTLTSRYCKNRLCIICNSIRQAQLIKQYEPIFNTWDSYFVTLTVPNVHAKDLKSTIKEMNDIFTLIKDKSRKHIQRVNKGKAESNDYMPDTFVGIKKIECTYNANRNDHHPHFHFIVDSEKTAKYILSEWLKRTKHLNTSPDAQDIRRCTNGKELELFKYFTKVVSSKDIRDGKDLKVQRLIDIKGVFDMFMAFKGVRTFQGFGFKLPKEESDELAEPDAEIEEPGDTIELESDVYTFDRTKNGYIGCQGDKLTKNKEFKSLDKIVESIESRDYIKDSWSDRIKEIYKRHT